MLADEYVEYAALWLALWEEQKNASGDSWSRPTQVFALHRYGLNCFLFSQNWI
jgi:hypothetical protein